MKKPEVFFILFLAAGVLLRITALEQLNWFLGDTLHVDEITYSQGDSAPYQRPPGTYFLASLASSTKTLRYIFSFLSLAPSIAFYLLSRKDRLNSIIAGVLAVEPTLAFSGMQILPAAPAAFLITLALLSATPDHSLRGRHLLSGWFIGCAALFRGEVLLFLPVSVLLLRPFRRWLTVAAGVVLAVLPLLLVNYSAGGSFAPGENGPMNLWLGSSWELLETPPGIEFEELMGNTDFLGSAIDAVTDSPAGWAFRGFQKVLAIMAVPGPGRNIEAGRLLGSTVLVFLLPLTAVLLAMGLAGLKRNFATALITTGLLSAFIFFPSVRHRVIFIPGFIISAATLLPSKEKSRWILAAVILIVVAAATFIYKYPAEVRSGLTELQLAQNHLENGELDLAFRQLESAETGGYYGADLHTIRGACIASSGGDFQPALEEFSRALEISPNSPSAWKNMAALLWNYGYREDAFIAAEHAVRLNPELRQELSPILSCQR